MNFMAKKDQICNREIWPHTNSNFNLQILIFGGFLIFAHMFNQPHDKIFTKKILSAKTVTGRQCPHSGKGEDFLKGQRDFFTETAVTPERKVEKSFPRWEINRHVEG